MWFKLNLNFNFCDEYIYNIITINYVKLKKKQFKTTNYDQLII